MKPHQRLLLPTIFIALTLTACQSQQTYTEIQKFNHTLALVKDDEQNLYFRSKGMVDDCSDWYSEKITVDGEPTIPLKNVLDIDTLNLTYNVHNKYYLSDKANNYLVLLTICDNIVMIKS